MALYNSLDSTAKMGMKDDARCSSIKSACVVMTMMTLYDLRLPMYEFFEDSRGGLNPSAMLRGDETS